MTTPANRQPLHLAVLGLDEVEAEVDRPELTLRRVSELASMAAWHLRQALEYQADVEQLGKPEAIRAAASSHAMRCNYLLETVERRIEDLSDAC